MVKPVELAVLAIENQGEKGLQILGKYWNVVYSIKDVKLLQELAPQHVQIKADGEGQLARLVYSVPEKGKPRSIEMALNTLFEKTNALELPLDGQELNACEQFLSRYMTTQLYAALHEAHQKYSIEVGTLAMPDCFKPQLRPYQERTVKWLLQRERVVCTLPAFYTQLTHKVQHEKHLPVFKHNYYNHVEQQLPPDIVLPPGGILADEMGLGKTVEIIALIILHPFTPTTDSCLLPQIGSIKPIVSPKRRRIEKKLFCYCSSNNMKYTLIECTQCHLWQHKNCVIPSDADPDEPMNEPYLCPSCWTKIMKDAEPMPTRATLVVMPSKIKSQWLDEIQRHVQPSLRVLVYNNYGFGKTRWISPRKLSDYDIVLCDYNILRSEFYLMSDSVHNTRNGPRFMRFTTPLLMLKWWRVCIDEAQMVESTSSNVTTLVHTLPAVNRWAVSGTPIQSNLDDVVGLLQFIGFPAACEPFSVWNTLVDDFVQRHTKVEASQLHLIDKVLRHCMWRTCKANVMDELDIPPQQFVLQRIQLSNLERLFYNEMQNTCEHTFRTMFAKHVQNDSDDTVKSISPQTLRLILRPLSKLRQTCSTAAVTTYSKGLIFMQPQRLHSHLKATNILECKIALRSMASSYNGIAANYFIRRNYEEAIRFYKLLLQDAEKYKNTPYYIDSMLQIHALHNLLEAYNDSGIREDKEILEFYETKCNELETQFLQRYATQLKSVKKEYNKILVRHRSLSAEVQMIESISEVIAHVESKDKNWQDPLLLRVYEECNAMFADKPTIHQIRSIGGILYVLDTWYKKTTNSLANLEEQFENLNFFTDNVNARGYVDEAVWRDMIQFTSFVSDCHLSDVRNNARQSHMQGDHATLMSESKRNVCVLCTVSKHINEFECLLFRKSKDGETVATEGVPSAEMTLLTTVCNVLKPRTSLQALQKNIDKQLLVLENFKNVFKWITKYWIEIEYAVKAFDELDMCKLRLTLAPNPNLNNLAAIDANWQIRTSDLDQNLNIHKIQLKQAQSQFIKKLGRLKYIMHLEKQEPDVCPICQTEIDPRYVVLLCGHHICVSCLKIYMPSNQEYITCPVCRNCQTTENFYCATRKSNVDKSLQTLKGNYATKIMYILRLVVELKHNFATKKCSEPPKILIFSQFYPILSAIADALNENDITHFLNCTPQHIEDFRNPKSRITCLLMLLSNGAKGLNLIEANTVILVEPILNPADELQAIGRVHRFGQTRPTTVYRFIVDGTIEENIFNTISQDSSGNPNWEFNDMTLSRLQNLFELENSNVY